METGIAKLTPELLALIGTGGVKAIAPFTREIFLLDIVVSGTSFCKQIDILEPQLNPGTVLKMIRHPENEYDELAIGIYFREMRIGWVPQELNEVISRLMDAGKAFFCRIQSCKRKNHWLRLDAKIYMVE
ncbi:MAG: HIRAN domain-containing protein [Porphyromonadaceae bacterium]|nr:HIRAN domain-containing protein [Porphyromonadaceae bacterium]